MKKTIKNKAIIFITSFLMFFTIIGVKAEVSVSASATSEIIINKTGTLTSTHNAEIKFDGNLSAEEKLLVASV